MNLRFGSPDRRAIMPSVIPSLKYSAFGSPLALEKGSTATEVMAARHCCLDRTLPRQWLQRRTPKPLRRSTLSGVTSGMALQHSPPSYPILCPASAVGDRCEYRRHADNEGESLSQQPC